MKHSQPLTPELSLLNPCDWNPFPRASDRQIWEGLKQDSLNRNRVEFLRKQTARLVAAPAPHLPDDGYATFVVTGDRGRFESIFFERRQNLALLVLHFCFEPTPLLLEAIARYLVAINEEISWAVPAHVARANLNDPNPQLDPPTLDLFSLETAASLAETLYLLQDELKLEHPAVWQQTRYQIRSRIINPFLEQDDFHWLSGQNNWTAWCVSSLLITAHYELEPGPDLISITSRSLDAFQKFIELYPDDGCDPEGPMYWSKSPGALLLGLEVLYTRTNGKISFYDHTKIKLAGEYIYKMHLGRGWAYNYSDSSPRLEDITAKVWRFGERLQNNEIMNFGLLALHQWQIDEGPSADLGFFRSKRCCGDLLQALREIFWLPRQPETPKMETDLDTVFEDSQVFIFRSGKSFNAPLILACKGGHNGVSHNHNDIGSYTITCGGEPVIIDVGRADYTRQTFSSCAERYAMWWNAGRGHNILSFDDNEQPPGGDFASDLVRLRTETEESFLHLDLTKTFPQQTGLLSWSRHYRMRRGPAALASITDTFLLNEEKVVKMPLFTCCDFLIGENLVTFQLAEGKKLSLHWKGPFSVREDSLERNEPSLERNWGRPLKKLLFQSQDPIKTGYLETNFSPLP